MRQHSFAAFALPVCLLLFAACSSGAGEPPPRPPEEASVVPAGSDIETISVPVRWASAVANDLPTLTANSDAIFVGRVVRLNEQRDEPLVSGALDESSAPVEGKPARKPGTFPISAYEVLVEQPLAYAGQTASTVLIEQAGGISQRADGSTVRLALEGDPPLEVGHRYLFFARQKDNGTLSAAPFARLLVTEHGLEPLPPWSNLGALKALAGKTAAEAMGLAQAAGGR